MPYASQKNNNAQQKRARDRHRVEGKCTRCNASPANGKLMCQYHLDYAAKANAKQPKEKRKAWSKKTHDKLKAEVYAHYGDKCACCGESAKEFLTIDHINGDGAEHKKQGIGGGTGILRWLRKNNFPSGYRVLCSNCNLAMGIYGYCPHNNLPPQTTNHPANPFRIKNKE